MMNKTGMVAYGEDDYSPKSALYELLGVHLATFPDQ